MFKRKSSANKTSNLKNPIILNYTDNGNLLISKSTQKTILKSIKSQKLKEIELLDYSISNLQSQIIILRKMIEDQGSILENEKQQLIKSIKQDINPDILCQICFENRVNLVLTPCGHTFCGKCLDNSSICFACRSPINDRFKIYFN
jgi:hypothetical protein